MQTEFVIAKCDVYCKWTGPYPRYRCYVNDELFSERTWIWQDVYLEENLQIQLAQDLSMRLEGQEYILVIYQILHILQMQQNGIYTYLIYRHTQK